MIEKIYAVGLRLSEDDPHDALESFGEMLQLAKTLDMVEVGKTFVVVREPTRSHLMGKGKTDEIKQEIIALNPDRILVDYQLSPLQSRNLEEAWGKPILDRASLIIEVFSRHATTADGKLQVELAQLNYKLPRLTMRNIEYDQQTGGGGSAYLRGAGERAISISKFQIRHKIKKLEDRIKGIAKHREVKSQRRDKSGLPLVSLVGYTNAGKSTLLNTLTGADVLTQNKLFSTLDTTVRSRTIDGRKLLFADTVGFIRNLPIELITAFRSTLEEVLTSWLIVHVFDTTDPEWERHIEVAESILDDLGAGHIERIFVGNKADLAESKQIENIQKKLPEAVFVSALKREGMDVLLEQILKKLN